MVPRRSGSPFLLRTSTSLLSKQPDLRSTLREQLRACTIPMVILILAAKARNASVGVGGGSVQGRNVRGRNLWVINVPSHNKHPYLGHSWCAVVDKTSVLGDHPDLLSGMVM